MKTGHNNVVIQFFFYYFDERVLKAYKNRGYLQPLFLYIWKFPMSGSVILILVFFENLLDFFQVSCNTLLIDSSLIL